MSSGCWRPIRPPGNCSTSCALSATLQDLPQQTLGEDLSDRVLQLAERRMLTEPQLPAEPAQLVEPARPAAAAATVRATLRRFLNARRWPGPRGHRCGRDVDARR